MLKLTILTFNIITTNKNKTAIAPTYIIMNIKPKNSTLKRKRIIDELKKVNIKKRTECTGFSDKKTKRLLNSKIIIRKVCNNCIYSI